MDTSQVLEWLENTRIAHLVSKSDHLVGATLQVIHIMGFLMLLAAIVLISLRVLGLVLREHAVSHVTAGARRAVWLGLGLAATSGLLMFVATPGLYFYNKAFILKMGLFVCAIFIHALLLGKAAGSDSPGSTTARIGVALSLLVWFSIAMAGRMIGFL